MLLRRFRRHVPRARDGRHPGRRKLSRRPNRCQVSPTFSQVWHFVVVRIRENAGTDDSVPRRTISGKTPCPPRRADGAVCLGRAAARESAGKTEPEVGPYSLQLCFAASCLSTVYGVFRPCPQCFRPSEYSRLFGDRLPFFAPFAKNGCLSRFALAGLPSVETAAGNSKTPFPALPAPPPSAPQSGERPRHPTRRSFPARARFYRAEPGWRRSTECSRLPWRQSAECALAVQAPPARATRRASIGKLGEGGHSNGLGRHVEAPRLRETRRLHSPKTWPYVKSLTASEIIHNLLYRRSPFGSSLAAGSAHTIADRNPGPREPPNYAAAAVRLIAGYRWTERTRQMEEHLLQAPPAIVCERGGLPAGHGPIQRRGGSDQSNRHALNCA